MKNTIILLVVSLIFVCHAFGDTICNQECQRRYRDKLDTINKLFNSKGDLAHYRNLEWQKQALDAAKNEFDACLSTCR